eukprot:CAMPEP_0174346130 /NCGR_PEP_ID=MMETSP0811_2-20130205/1715_1 /TAXON_ID=73025 ORGANISM="Eutreptiella gymnastica-like, Strain CCMP1594" /NCGR_SAMPLE_ID=MMETSP0811_2 /ASSEMBLY_ACC=CAM_ASM_000667 /LENGTH=32 /DNA_ID= /DNA_START= /DNA_END= /DNA_ORIENTATION=
MCDPHPAAAAALFRGAALDGLPHATRGQVDGG